MELVLNCAFPRLIYYAFGIFVRGEQICGNTGLFTVISQQFILAVQSLAHRARSVATCTVRSHHEFVVPYRQISLFGSTQIVQLIEYFIRRRRDNLSIFVTLVVINACVYIFCAVLGRCAAPVAGAVVVHSPRQSVVKSVACQLVYDMQVTSYITVKLISV